MPIYEYICKNCGHQMEEMQGINDEPLKKCPECGKNKLEKMLSAPAFHLKGTGWYVTDFKNPGKKAETKAEPSTTSTEKEKSTTTAEKKTADKKDKPKE